MLSGFAVEAIFRIPHAPSTKALAWESPKTNIFVPALGDKNRSALCAQSRKRQVSKIAEGKPKITIKRPPASNNLAMNFFKPRT